MTTPVTIENYTNNIPIAPEVISQNIDDALVSIFEKITQNRESAYQVASAIVTTTIKQGLDINTVLGKFANIPPNQLNLLVAMFLNTNRVGTSRLGINTSPVVSKYIARTILS